MCERVRAGRADEFRQVLLAHAQPVGRANSPKRASEPGNAAALPRRALGSDSSAPRAVNESSRTAIDNDRTQPWETFAPPASCSSLRCDRT